MNDNLINRLLTDEAVIFIAERHLCSPKEITDCYASQDGKASNLLSSLEENERQIIGDLIKMYKDE